MKVLVGVNVLANVHSLAYGNHCKFWFQCAKSFPTWEFHLMAPPRMSIDRMRNMCSKFAMENGFDILIFIDDDTILPTDAFKTLMETLSEKNPIVSGLTYIRGYPYRPMLFKKFSGEDGKQILGLFEAFKDHISSNAQVLCDAVGFSFVGIHVSLLLKVSPPHFITGTMNTEDVYFCCKVKDKFPDIPIICDTRIKTGHIGENIILHEFTVEKFKKIEESYYFEGALEPKGRDLDWMQKQAEAIRVN